MFLHLTLLALILSACSGSRPQNLGVENNTLKPCPDKPNCVSSFSKSDKHRIAPLAIQNSVKGISAIKKIVSEMPRTNIVQESSNYLYVEFTSKLMGFTDDTEFLASSDAPLIHVRSASRSGYSDMGVNRDRIEQIRSKLPQNP